MFITKKENRSYLKQRTVADHMSRPIARKPSRIDVNSQSPDGSDLSLPRGKPEKLKSKVPRNHPLKAEALTSDDFLLIEFEGGRPHIFVDFIKHMTFHNYYEL